MQRCENMDGKNGMKTIKLFDQKFLRYLKRNKNQTKMFTNKNSVNQRN